MLDHLAQQISERLRATGKVETVFGEPQELEGKTVIPVARVGYWYGFGAGEGRDAEHGGSGSGGGGGAGISVQPLGAFVITETDERFVPFRTWRSAMTSVVFGFILGLLVGRRAYRR